MKRILFLDDERVLRELRRALDPLADRWQMTFLGDEQEALGLLDEGRVDVVVSDSALPEHEGSLLLARARERSPAVVRLMLVSDEELAGDDGAGQAHQLVPKSCSQTALATSIARACALHNLLSDPRLVRLAEHLGRKPELALRDCTRLAELDLASVRAEWERLFGALAAADRAAGGRATLEHALEVAVRTRAILGVEASGARALADGFLAGLLHDVGELVLAASLPERFRAACALAQDSTVERTRVETRLFGASHAALGAYLLGLAGLSTTLVEAVAFHHRPSQWSDTSFGPLAAVHVANALAEARASGGEPALDHAFLRRIARENRVEAWSEACELALEA